MNKGNLRKKLVLGIASLRSGSNLFSSQSVFADWYRNQDKHGRHRIRKAFASLEEGGFIKIFRDNEKMHIELTSLGQELLERYKFDDIQVIPRPRWDGKWRLILIDIPESKKGIRNLIRSKFKKLGFYSLQRSVWIYPHECETEVGLISDVLRVSDRVRLAHVKTFDGEDKVKKEFGL